MKDLVNLVMTDQPRNLGLQLNLDESDLNVVEKDLRNDHAAQLSKVLSLYMKESLSPSWVEVATALWNIKEKNRAKVIAKKFGIVIQ